MLAKKDYRAIASIINKLEMGWQDKPITLILIDDLIEELSIYFKQDNPLFNKQKFIDACWK